MTTNELKEYLSNFPESGGVEVGFLVAWPEKRKFYHAEVGAFTDTNHPVMVIQITGEEDFDEELTEAAKEEEIHMSRTSTTQFRVEGGKTIKTYSYVVTLCRKGTDEVKAVRLDGFTSKYDQDFREALAADYPETEWTTKSVLKLYESDFE